MQQIEQGHEKGKCVCEGGARKKMQQIEQGARERQVRGARSFGYMKHMSTVQTQIRKIQKSCYLEIKIINP